MDKTSFQLLSTNVFDHVACSLDEYLTIILRGHAEYKMINNQRGA